MNQLSIVQIGNFKFPWCTEVHLGRDLRALGHKVEQLQEPSTGEARFLVKVANACRLKKADLCLFTRTRGLHPKATDLWRDLEAAGTETCSVHLDLYLGLQRQGGVDGDSFWTTNHVFTPDGDPSSQQWFVEHGINHHWSPPGVLYDACTPGRFQERFNYDVVFVGSDSYHREWPWRPTLIRALRERYGNRFRRFGGDQPEGPIREQALNDLYASAKIVVGDSLALPGKVNYWSDRPYETVGRGGFLIMPRVPGLDVHFTDGEHLVYYDHPGPDGDVLAPMARLFDTIDAWLPQAGERARVKAAGQAHVREHHTYRHRLAAALDTMKLEPRRGAKRKVASRRPVPGASHYEVVGSGGAGGVVSPADSEASALIAAGALGAGVTMDEIRARYAHGRIERLELGSGYHPTPGFTHLDINPDAPDVDVVGPAYPLNLPDGSVGEIRAVDVLEHISYRLTDKVLDDWFRVLKPGGKLFVQVPDAGRIMLAYSEHCRSARGLAGDDLDLTERIPPELPQTALMGATWRLLGGHEDADNGRDGVLFNAHFALFSESSLREALIGAGFVVDAIERNGHPNLLVNCEKP